MTKLVIFLAIAVILLASTITSQNVLALSKIEKQVNKFIRQETTGGSKLSDLCTVTLQVKDKENVSKTFRDICEESEPEPTPDPEPIPDNDTDPIPDPDPDPIPDNNTDPVPEQPTSNETWIVNFVGDVYGSNGDKVFNEMKSNPFDLAVILGDLWYGNWEKFDATYGTLGNKVACVLGNHEYDSSEVEQLSLKYCGNDWFIKKNNVLIIGANANEGLDTQLKSAKELFNDNDFMEDVDTVILNTHQPCRNTDNSHHGVENDVRAFCEEFEQALPEGTHYFIAGHEHLMMEGESNGNKYFISGAGGREHYDCGTLDDVFSWCDDSHYGYLQLKIEPDGKITEQFIDYNGGVVN